MVNSEVLQSAHLKGYQNSIGSCKTLPQRDATSHGCRSCLTSEPHAATAIPVHQASQEPPLAPRPPHAVWLVSLHQNQGNHSQTVHREWPPAHENTHWQRPNPCQSLCKRLSSMGDLTLLLKALCPCLVVFSVGPATETHLTSKSLLSSFLRKRTFSA